MPPKPKRPDLTKLSDTDKDRLIDAPVARLDAVEVKLDMNSENSSKPPSFDGLVKKSRKTSSLRGKSGKSVGGQSGRKGITLKRMAESIETVEYRLSGKCSRCRNALPLEDALVLEQRQVFAQHARSTAPRIYWRPDYAAA